MNPFKRAEVRAREAEYQAMWQACERAARKDEYQKSTVPVRLVILREALTGLLEKRYAFFESKDFITESGYGWVLTGTGV